MNQYLVTITPVAGGDGDAGPQPQMVVRVDVSDGEPHIVELTMRAPAHSDLASGELPPIDLERLAHVFRRTVTPTPPAVAAGAEAVGTGPAPRRRGGRRSGRATAAATAGQEQPTPRPEPVRPQAATKAPRAYRRMPDPDELRQVYTEVNSIAGVAKHYQVPTHTAQGWIGRLRRYDLTDATSQD